MSKTQLQTNNTRLASLITELRGKAAGGGASVETCTVTVNGGYIIGATVCNNGEITTVTYYPGETNTQDNVVCGSIVYFVGDTYAEYALSNCYALYETVFGLTSFNVVAIETGVTEATITVSSDAPPSPEPRTTNLTPRSQEMII